MTRAFVDELEQLRLQVEVLAVRVDQNLEEMRTVLQYGDLAAARRAMAADDQIDDAVVSLIERCHDLLIREAPMASDNRLLVAIIRVLNELERVGDLSLRVAKLAPDHALLVANASTYDILVSMAETAIEQYRMALRAWSSRDLAQATALADGSADMEAYYERLMEGVLRMDGPDAVPAAVTAVLAGRAIERIADHAVIIGDRLRYLLTADPRYLAREVAPSPGSDA